ncbi:MAG: transcription antitermination factor NusB, partial [Moraxellaceae bacterium]
VLEKRENLLDYIKPKLKNWDAERIAQLDMIVMQMGIAEFLYFETIPPKVTINEYIDIAKEYSTAQSGQFVNGILDSIHKELIAEGKMKASDFPDLDKETFIKAPVKGPLDGIEFDGNKPNEYLEKLPLGLKGNQKA